MFIFGGCSQKNEKLNDLWRLDLHTWLWKEMQVSENIPLPRSGHSADFFQHFIVIHGGHFESMKELNDTWVFDIVTKEWHCLFKNLWALETKQEYETFDVTDDTYK